MEDVSVSILDVLQPDIGLDVGGWHAGYAQPSSKAKIFGVRAPAEVTFPTLSLSLSPSVPTVRLRQPAEWDNKAACKTFEVAKRPYRRQCQQGGGGGHLVVFIGHQTVSAFNLNPIVVHNMPSTARARDMMLPAWTVTTTKWWRCRLESMSLVCFGVTNCMSTLGSI